MKIHTLFFFILTSWQLCAQDPIVVPEIPKSKTRSLDLLAQSLGENTISEREKVDRIFAWVIHNISYDYKLYLSGKGTRKNDPKDVLKKRSGVCGDFSSLLDTLFQLNGLESQVITGYVKEVYFDPGDPIYFSNHVWNAVKIDRLWYLCDPTFCTSLYEYEFTKRSLKRMDRIRRLGKKVKVRSRKTRIIKDSDCFETSVKYRIKTDSIIPLVPRIMIFFLDQLPLRVKIVQSKAANLNYYLTDPNVFSIDHFPDDPTWSLQSKYDSVENFSKDSIYFYRSMILQDYQNKKGVFCIDCDRLTQLNSRESIYQKMLRSEKNNSKNKFLQAKGFTELAIYSFRRFLNEEDSLMKLGLMDSLLFQIKMAQGYYKAAKINANYNQRYQDRKNRFKKKIAFNHFYWMRKQMRSTQNAFQKEFLKSKSLAKKVRRERQRIPKNIRAFRKAEYKYYREQSISEDRGYKLIQMLQQYEKELDSLNREKLNFEQKIGVDMDSLNESISAANRFLTPIYHSLMVDRWYRLVDRKDNFDLELDTLEAKLRFLVQAYQWTMDSMIIEPSQRLYSDFKNASYNERRRLRLSVKIIKLTKKMVAYGLYSNESFQELCLEHYEKIETNKCWLAKLKLPSKELSRRLKAIRKLERSFNLALSKSISAENYRFVRIKKLLQISTKRVHNSSDHNIQFLNRLKRRVYRERERYMKQFK